MYICIMKKICGIYKITSPSNRVYIGQSIDIKKRFAAYKNNECINQHRLKASFKKYGICNHSFEIIHECDISELNDKEIYFINKFNSIKRCGLNISHGGIGVMRNRKHSDYTKNKIRNKKIGLKASEDTKKKMSESRKKWRHTDESKKKMSDLAKGKNTWSKGSKMSDIFKDKIKQSWVIRKQKKL